MVVYEFYYIKPSATLTYQATFPAVLVIYLVHVPYDNFHAVSDANVSINQNTPQNTLRMKHITLP